MAHFPSDFSQNQRLTRLLRFSKILTSALSDTSDALDVPILRSITGPMFTVLETAQSITINKSQCIMMLEGMHMILSTSLELCLAMKGSLNPDIGALLLRFSETITKVNVCLARQEEGGRIRRFLRAAERSAEIQECSSQVDKLIEDLRVMLMAIAGRIANEVKSDVVARQQRILDLIQDSLEADSASSLRGSSHFSGASSGVISLLPGTPKIFYGREAILGTLIAALQSAPARVAILGTAGIGKTSLAVAGIQDPRIVQIFPQRYFISCEHAHKVDDLLVVMAAYFDLPRTSNLKRSILEFLSAVGPSILVLDNFETLWESHEESQDAIERFLGLLTDIGDLGLVVTMRGLERPGGVRWTRPFLPPLDPLDPTAARQIYVDIADEPIGEEEEAHMEELLALTDNLPLAITLMANNAAFEGASATLARYRVENTDMLSQGYDKRSNLHKSIKHSLCSRRITGVPDAIILLALLSLLPDGISMPELLQCDGIREILRCKSTLIRTSVAFLGPDERIRVLMPIREYMQKFYPPMQAVVKPFRTYLSGLLRAWNAQLGLESTKVILDITANLGNMGSVMQYCCDNFADDMKGIGHGILHLDAFLSHTYGGLTDMFARLPDIIKATGEESLEGLRICALLDRHPTEVPSNDAEALVYRGIPIFRDALDAAGEAQLYNDAVEYYNRTQRLQEATRWNELSLSLPHPGDLQRYRATYRGSLLRMMAGAHRPAILLAMESKTIARRMGNSSLVSKALQIEALLCAWLGQLPRALALCQEARGLLVTCGLEASYGEVTILDVEAFVHSQKTDYPRAREAHQVIVNMASPGKFDMYCAIAEMNTIRIDMLMGRAAQDILDRLSSVMETAERITFPEVVWDCDLTRAQLNHREGDLAGAIEEYKRCLDLARSTNVFRACTCLELISDAYLEKQYLDEAFRWVVVYLAQSRKGGIVDTIQALRRMGDLFFAMGDENTAKNLYTLGLEAFTKMEVHCGRAECMVRLGMLVREDTAMVRHLWTDARELFKQAGRTSQAAEIDERLTSLT
ncbi:hypothetical protein DFH09DRAFT_1464506 [Mycena vulgaris]|nr:hypothetical protein DFH09DRAFT_1499706 [Mycena vulgaris]KAJ6570654.1 hypothetical protein DFH09DRAFT_1464506 [Mycena vulgaris]